MPPKAVSSPPARAQQVAPGHKTVSRGNGSSGGVSALSKRLVTDELWSVVAPLLPSFSSRPQGGGTAPIEARTVFTAVVYVLTSDCAWRQLPPAFSISQATAHRHFHSWTKAGLWSRLRRSARAGGDRCEPAWVLEIVTAALARSGTADRKA
nr:transposase [Kribbella solani]